MQSLSNLAKCRRSSYEERGLKYLRKWMMKNTVSRSSYEERGLKCVEVLVEYVDDLSLLV